MTGSAPAALGIETAALFSHDDDMLAGIKSASEKTFEAVWHMPLNDEHRAAIAGRLGGDVNNLGKNRFGGSSQAAAFLEKFVEDERPWAHLDIAGPYNFGEKETGGFGA